MSPKRRRFSEMSKQYKTLQYQCTNRKPTQKPPLQIKREQKKLPQTKPKSQENKALMMPPAFRRPNKTNRQRNTRIIPQAQAIKPLALIQRIATGGRIGVSRGDIAGTSILHSADTEIQLIGTGHAATGNAVGMEGVAVVVVDAVADVRSVETWA